MKDKLTGLYAALLNLGETEYTASPIVTSSSWDVSDATMRAYEIMKEEIEKYRKYDQRKPSSQNLLDIFPQEPVTKVFSLVEPLALVKEFTITDAIIKKEYVDMSNHTITVPFERVFNCGLNKKLAVGPRNTFLFLESVKNYPGKAIPFEYIKAGYDYYKDLVYYTFKQPIGVQLNNGSSTAEWSLVVAKSETSQLDSSTISQTIY